MLTENFLKTLYINPSINYKNPKIQLLNFEVSQINSNQIILRLSDGKSFIDSPLSGPYSLQNGEIKSQQLYQSNRTIRKNDIVTIDYFSKFCEDRMCRLQLIIRKIQSISSSPNIIGQPEQISQYIQNHQKNIFPFLSNPEFANNLFKIQNPDPYSSISRPWPIPSNFPNSLIKTQQSNNDSSNNSSKKSGKRSLDIENTQNNLSFQSNFLDLHQIQNGKDGVFIGRLVRIKSGVRELKQSGNSITVLYLGFIDLNNNLVRISLVGKNALREQEHLVKYHVYTIKGIEGTTLDKARFIYNLKLKDRQYNIKRVTQQPYVSILSKYWFHFQHEPSKNINIQQNQVQIVDVIGIVDQIQEKITYKNIHSFHQEREVIRITVKNIFKSLKISFWAEQIKILDSIQLKKYDQIILYDLKKKKNIFLDFTIQSNVIKLKDEPQLRQIYAGIFPESQTISQPENIKSMIEYFEIDSNKNKVKHVKVYLMKIYDSKVIFKICEQCKRKIQFTQNRCSECGCNNSLYKFNCLMEFVDSTGSLKCVSFDPTTQKILGKSASEIHQMDEQEIRNYFEQFYYNQYEIGIQNKNQRFVLRNIQVFQNSTKWTKNNIEKINVFKEDPQFRHLL